MANFLVTTLLDSGDDATITGALLTDSTDGGGLSLREAILFANTTADADTITFDASLTNGLIRLTSGTITITDDLTIDGSTLNIVITGDVAGNDGVVTGTNISDLSQNVFLEDQDNVRLFDATNAAADLTIGGLTLTGGQTNASGEDGGALRAAGNLTLDNVTVAGNAARGSGSDGGGVFVGGDASITGSTISDNLVVANFAGGGGIYVSGALNLSDSTVNNNNAYGAFGNGGGIELALDVATITNSIIQGNTLHGANSVGGGLQANEAIISGSQITNNQSTSSGGGLAVPVLTLTDSVVSGNSTTNTFGNGGGVATQNAVISGSTFENNGANGDSSGGGGVFASGLTRITDSVFRNNSTGSDFGEGGAVSGRDLTISRSTFENNSTNGDRSDGGAVSASGLTVDQSTFTGNTAAGEATKGGAISVVGSATITGTTISDSILTGTNVNGGGLYVRDSLQLVNSQVSENTIRGNGFSVAGGGIYVSQLNDSAASPQSVEIVGTTISDNAVTGPRAFGGGFIGFGAHTPVTFINSTVSGNTTTGPYGDGAGILARDLTVTSSTISGNASAGADGEGGGIRTNTLALSNSIISGNSTYAAGLGYDEFQAVNAVTYTGVNIVGDTLFNGTIATQTGLAATDIFAAAVETQADTNSDGTPDTGTGAFGGVLSQNAGTTQTIAILSGGAADGAGDAAALPADTFDVDGDGDTTEPLPLDQHGVDRTVGGTLDLGAVQSAEAGGLIVTTLDDVVNDFDGLTSLREAVAFTNAQTGADTITFDAGLTGLIRLTEGEIEISDALTIEGGGQITLTGDADDNDVTVEGDITDVAASGSALLADNSRIFNIIVGSSDTTLIGLTLTGGHTSGGNDDGGAVYSAANLSLSSTQIIGNKTSGSSAYGGGIFSRGSTIVVDTTISSNFTEGSVGRGGGVASIADVAISGSVISNNSTSGGTASGGAVYARGSVLVADSSISGNNVSGNSASGGGIFGNQAVSVFGSTISDNISSSIGGGVFAREEITLTNTTIGGNSTTGVSGSGGGINGVKAIIVTNSTITGNSTAGVSAEGGGLFSFGYDAQGITLTNSIVLGNSSNAANLGFDEIFQGGVDVNVTYAGGNIVGTDIFDGASDVGDTSVSQVFAQVSNGAGVLADNGGAVQTVAVLVGGDAVGQGDETLLPADTNDLDGDGDTIEDLPLDANGNARVLGGALDLGAVEAVVLVTTLDDVVNAEDGLTSLREAVVLANGAADADTILFASDLSGTLRLTQGEIEITDAITIDGDGRVTITGDAAGDDILDGNGFTDVAASFGGTTGAADDLLDDNSRIFNISASSAISTLEGLTITGGRTTGTATADYGGAVTSDASSVTISNSHFVGNSTLGERVKGGALNARDLIVEASTFEGNQNFGLFGGGGAIYTSGEGTINASYFSQNSTHGRGSEGGAVYTHEAADITDSIFTGNYTTDDFAQGGAVFVGSRADMTGNTFSENFTLGDRSEGGAVSLRSNSTISDSTFANNSVADGDGGAVNVLRNVGFVGNTFSGNSSTRDGGAIHVVSFGSAYVHGSVFFDNRATGQYSEGGAIATSGRLTSVNSTFASNYVTGSSAIGGAIFSEADLVLSQTTITGNRSEGTGIAGGIYNNGAAGSDVTLSNSIVSGNASGTVPAIASDLTIAASDGTVSFSGANIIGTNIYNGNTDVGDTTTAQVFASVISTNGVDAGVLGDNGGTAQTIALNAIGSAVDAGDLALLPADIQDVDGDADTAEPLPLDARSAPRVQGAAPDLGAFEVNRIDGDGGANSLTGTDAGEIIDGGGGDDTIDAGAGSDLIEGGGGQNLLLGGAGDDSIVGGSSADAIDGGADNDNIAGNNGNDVIVIRDGQNTVDAGFGDDTIILETTNNTVNGSGNTDQLIFLDPDVPGAGITLDLGNDPNFTNIENVTGAPGASNTITGSEQSNTLKGGDQSDILDGAGGDDRISGGAGLDVMYGGDGDDIFVVDDAQDQVFEFFGEGYDRILSSISQLPLADGVEAGNLTGTADLSMTGNDLNNWLNGNSGNNDLRGGLGNDRIDGNGGDDTIDGGEGNDILEGGSGADIFIAGGDGGIDRILDFNTSEDRIDLGPVGLTFDDIVIGDLNGDALVLYQGGRIIVNGVDPDQLSNADFIDTALPPSNTTVDGSANDDVISIGFGPAELNGLGGNDLLRVLEGAATLQGGSGDDRYFVFNDDQQIIEAEDEGYDRIYAFVDLELADNVEAATAFGDDSLGLSGNDLDNWLTANSAGTSMEGFDGNDRLQGKDGDDDLDGGAGNDILEAGGGANIFIFDNDHGFDRIIGFSIDEDLFEFQGSFDDIDELTFSDIQLSDTAAGALLIFDPFATDAANAVLIEGVATISLTEENFDFGA